MMNLHPLGQTRTHVAHDHALVGTDSHVPSPIYGWTDTRGVVLISPSMAAGGSTLMRGPQFVQTLATLTCKSRTSEAAPGVQRLIYVLEGEITVEGSPLSIESFAYLPADSTYQLTCADHAKILMFEKAYVPRDGFQAPSIKIGKLSDVPAEPFLGDEDARLACLLPDEPAFDMAVNVFTYQSGAALPFVETHVMEHGLYMSAGQGIYRLADCWYPVTQGDSIWMASYCPQWFVAMGKTPAQYIYYKDIHRNPLHF